MNCIYLRERCIQCKENNLLKNDTYSFIHTVMGFVITSSDESRLGIIGQPCIIQNATPEDYNISKELDNFFKGFGKGVYYAFCDVAPKCGYDRRQMQGIFCDLFNDWKGVIIKLNAQKSNAFWEDGFPVVKKFFKAWIYLIPFAIIPSFMAKFILKTAYPIYVKFKNILFKKRLSQNAPFSKFCLWKCG